MTGFRKSTKRRMLRSSIRPTPYQKLLFDPTANLRSFVVQKHAATRLHYDLRLEHAGILICWVVHDGPCLDPNQRREAVLVNDHPIKCARAEWVIPAGLYGAGAILTWDCGIWRTDQDVDRALRAGQLKFELLGQKLKGIWSLSRRSHQPDVNGEKWLLCKENDAEAKSLSEMDILVEEPASVLSGRTLDEIASDLPPFILGKPRRNSKKPAPNQLPLFPDDVEPDLHQHLPVYKTGAFFSQATSANRHEREEPNPVRRF